MCYWAVTFTLIIRGGSIKRGSLEIMFSICSSFTFFYRLGGVGFLEGTLFSKSTAFVFVTAQQRTQEPFPGLLFNKRVYE